MRVVYKGLVAADTIAGHFRPGEEREVPDEIGKLLLNYGFEEVKTYEKEKQKETTEEKEEEVEVEEVKEWHISRSI